MRSITPRTETGIAAIAITAILLIIVLSLLAGCKTKTVTITETLYVHDTITSHKTDTIVDIRVKTDSVVEYKMLTSHDTTIIERENTIVLRENGDTLRQSELEKVWQKIHDMENLQHIENHFDSLGFYKVQNDSLRKALAENKSRDKTVVKTEKVIKWWEYVLLLAIVGIAIYFVLRRK